MTTTEFFSVIRTSKTTFEKSTLSVTRAMERPMDKTILSRIFTCLPLKKIRDQANPGIKNTIIVPTNARRMVIGTGASEYKVFQT